MQFIFNNQNSGLNKVGGIQLCYSCAVWVMLATLVMTARSCFNHWRQTDARHQLKPFHLLLNNVNIDWKARTCRATNGSFNLKVLHGTLTVSLVVSLWGSDGFFRFYHDWDIQLFLLLYFVARKSDKPMTFTSNNIATFTGYKVIRYNFTVLRSSTFSLFFECVANMMMSPTPLFPEVMAEHNFSNFSW